MKRRTINQLRQEELERMPTKALLGRLKNLHKCEESLEFSDLQEQEIGAENVIRFKVTSEWQTAYKDVKSVLGKREHIPRKDKLRRIKG